MGTYGNFDSSPIPSHPFPSISLYPNILVRVLFQLLLLFWGENIDKIIKIYVTIYRFSRVKSDCLQHLSKFISAYIRIHIHIYE